MDSAHRTRANVFGGSYLKGNVALQSGVQDKNRWELTQGLMEPAKEVQWGKWPAMGKRLLILDELVY